MIGPEQFECLNCFHIGGLSARGGCEECNSQAVISQELISLKSRPCTKRAASFSFSTFMATR
jgi:hypothetical protein